MKRITAIITFLTLLTAILLPNAAMAANVCNMIYGDTNAGSVTFTITTDSKWYTSNYVKLTASKGKIAGTNSKIYGCFDVTVTGGGKNTTDHWHDGSYKIKHLKANTTYTVTVTPTQEEVLHKFAQNAMAVFGTTSAGGISSSDPASWTVKKTSGVTLCE